MSAFRTTYGMVLDCQEAVVKADELVEAAGLLLADAVLDGLDLDPYVQTFRKAKAQRTLAALILEGTRSDWHRDYDHAADYNGLGVA